MKKSEFLKSHRDIISFLFIGALGLGLNLSLTYVFTEFIVGRERYLLAFGIGTFANWIWTYFMQSTFTFHVHRNIKQALAFYTYTIIFTTLAFAATHTLVMVLGDKYYLPIILLVVGTGSMVTYAVQKYLIFKI